MRIKRWPIGHKENEVKSHHSLWEKFIQKMVQRSFQQRSESDVEYIFFFTEISD